MIHVLDGQGSTGVRLLLCVLSLVSLASSATCAPSNYVWFVDDSLRTPVIDDADNRQSSVLFRDDAPLQTLDLPFLFPFFGTPYKRAYLSPNGGLHFGGASGQQYVGPCCLPTGCTLTYSSSGCNFNTSYNNMIAAFVTDLYPLRGVGAPNPADVRYGSIFNASEDAGIAFRFTNVPMFSYSIPSSPLPTQSFSLSIFESGSVEVALENVVDPSLFGYVNSSQRRTWLMGLRPPQGDPRDGTAFKTEWHTSLDGVYPPRPLMRSGRTLSFCSLGASLCSSPSFGDASGGTDIAITSSQIGCFVRYWHMFHCIFDGQLPGSEARYDATLGALVCKTPALAVGLHFLTLNFSSSVSTLAHSVVRLPALSFSAVPASDSRLGAGYARNYSWSNDTGSGRGLCHDCSALAHHVQTGFGNLRHFCQPDCAGVVRGGAVFDACGVCSGGTSSITPGQDLDCAGVCFGHSSQSTVNGTCACSVSPSICSEEREDPRTVVPYVSHVSSGPVDFVQVYEVTLAALVTLVMGAELLYALRSKSNGTSTHPPWRTVSLARSSGDAVDMVYAGNHAHEVMHDFQRIDPNPDDSSDSAGESAIDRFQPALRTSSMAAPDGKEAEDDADQQFGTLGPSSSLQANTEDVL